MQRFRRVRLPSGAWSLIFWPVLLSLVLLIMLYLPIRAHSQFESGPLTGQTITIVLPTNRTDDAAIQLALGDLRTVLETKFGAHVQILTDLEIDRSQPLPPHTIVVGETADELVRTIGIDTAELLAEGYLVTSIDPAVLTGSARSVSSPAGSSSALPTRVAGPLAAFTSLLSDLGGRIGIQISVGPAANDDSSANGPAIVIVGRGPLGPVYGLFDLVERTKLEPRSIFTEDRRVTGPKMTLRAVSDPLTPNYPEPEQALRWGFNAIFVDAWPGLALFDRFDPAIFEPKRYSDERAWVLANRQRTADRIARAKALHLQVLTWGDLPSLPRQTLEIYHRAVSDDDDPSKFCLAKAQTQRLISAQLDEVLTDFPGIDAVMVRTGENYALGPLIGNIPADAGVAGCLGTTAADRLELAMDLVYQQVVKDHGKQYIQRAWDIGDQGFHANPDVADALTQTLANRPSDKLMISFKQTQTDFWRYNPVNPNFGNGKIPQMAEFQAAREYEGKGAFPNFLGEEFAAGAGEVSPHGGVQYLYDRGVRAIWVWAKGGGWNGPTIKHDTWIDANIYAIGHLAWDPLIPPGQLARDWATIQFGPSASPFIARLLMRSDDAVLHAFYVKPYAERHTPWAPNNVWIRDDVIHGAPSLAELYRGSRAPGDFQIAITEQALARRIVAQMIRDFEQARPFIADQQLAAELQNTLYYEQALIDTTSRYLIGMFQYYAWEDSGRINAPAQTRALENLKAAKEYWYRYVNEVANLPGVASPYQDAGMIAAIDDALEALQVKK